MSQPSDARAALKVGGRTYEIFRLEAATGASRLAQLPFSIRILLENLLRTHDGVSVNEADIRAVADWDPRVEPDKEIAFTPARVLMQDFTGVPAVVDLAAMRDAMARLGSDPSRINPLQPAELVIDHSVQVDAYGSSEALRRNTDLEYERNRERYVFLRWGQTAFRNFKTVPPETGIVHQVNVEYLARVVFATEGARPQAYPDTLVGTDSHTTMVNGLGVLGWGVGGIEAEAAMLGQPVSMLLPQVVGFRLTGSLAEGATATDLVLTVTQMLRKHGVVGKFVEFFGPGLSDLPLADRATMANMAPEYGATCGIFPVDAETLRYLRFSGRPAEQVALVEAYMKEQGLFHTPQTPEATYSSVLHLDLATVEPSVAGPKRPQDRLALREVKAAFQRDRPSLVNPKAKSSTGQATVHGAAGAYAIGHGAVVIAAITSCTNTSNPSVLMAAGLLARKAVEKGLKTPPWVKTSLAPGSKVVTEYLAQAGLLDPLARLGFHVVGYGCTTCIGNSGPIPAEISRAIGEGDLVVSSVLSGNRNFEGRVHPEVRANYLMSPPLVVAYALAGSVDIDLIKEPIGRGTGGSVYLRDIWPTNAEVASAIESNLKSEMFRRVYAEVFQGDARWRALPAPQGARYEWDEASIYIRNPPYFNGMEKTAPKRVAEISGARVLAVLGDSVTTDHISPAGNIRKDSPAGKYLMEHGVDPKDFNQYGARRGNHEVMMRGTFANVRIRNHLAPGTEGGVTSYLKTGEVMSIYDAAMRYKADGIPLVVLAGKEYGSGSSRDWAAKGPFLLGIRVVIAESYERIHRSNLVGMGILPLEFPRGQQAASLGLNGREVLDFTGLAEGMATNFAGGRSIGVTATAEDGSRKRFDAIARIDTAKEAEYYRNGGILQYVLRKLAE